MFESACLLLAEDLALSPGVPGGMEAYRMTLCTSFFYKFFISVLQQLEHQQVSPHSSLSNQLKGGRNGLRKMVIITK